MKLLAYLLMISVIGLSLAACGLRGPPTPPVGSAVTWPGKYPAE